jgi:glycosyltransferase involved in cell wall biosynthesis
VDNHPKISIVIPTYNREDFLEATVQSVLDQTYSNFEVVLVDDGSSDRTVLIGQHLADQHAQVVFHERDKAEKGASVCRNIGANKATGDYLLFLDSDDLLADFCLQQRAEQIQKQPDLEILIFPMLLFQKEWNDMMILSNIPTEEDALDRYIKRDNVWLMSSPVWKREAFLKMGGFDEKLLSYQDNELNVRALAKGLKYQYFSVEEGFKPDNYYRQQSSGTISETRFNWEHLESQEQMLLNNFKLLTETGTLTENRRIYLAQFFLLLAEWWRFHQGKDKQKAKENGRNVWRQVKTIGLLTGSQALFGMWYIRFKSQLIFVRIPWFQKPILWLMEKLLIPKLIWKKPTTIGKVKFVS